MMMMSDDGATSLPCIYSFHSRRVVGWLVGAVRGRTIGDGDLLDIFGLIDWSIGSRQTKKGRSLLLWTITVGWSL